MNAKHKLFNRLRSILLAETVNELERQYAADLVVDRHHSRYRKHETLLQYAKRDLARCDRKVSPATYEKIERKVQGYQRWLDDHEHWRPQGEAHVK